MKLYELRDAFPSVSQECREMMAQTAHDVSVRETRPAWNLRKGIVVCLIVLLAMASVAYAAVRLGIFDYLIGSDEE